VSDAGGSHLQLAGPACDAPPQVLLQRLHALCPASSDPAAAADAADDATSSASEYFTPPAAISIADSDEGDSSNHGELPLQLAVEGPSRAALAALAAAQPGAIADALRPGSSGSTSTSSTSSTTRHEAVRAMLLEQLQVAEVGGALLAGCLAASRCGGARVPCLILLHTRPPATHRPPTAPARCLIRLPNPLQVYTELFRAVSLQLQDLLALLGFDPSASPPPQQQQSKRPEQAQQEQQEQQEQGQQPEALSWSGITSALAASITADRQQLLSRLGKLQRAFQQLRWVLRGAPAP
jgi:hypothetical protein